MNSTSELPKVVFFCLNLMEKYSIFRKSLKLEPAPKSQSTKNETMAVPTAALMNQGASSFCNLESGIASLNVSPAKSSSMRLNAGQSTKFSLGHRKTQSLGSK